MVDADVGEPALILLLGDQLSLEHGAMKDARAGIDTILMAEVREEATYVRHNRQKIALVFAAMRHRRDELRKRGFSVIYFCYDEGKRSLLEAVEAGLGKCDAALVRCCEPGEFRLLNELRQWKLTAALEIVEDDRFLADHDEFAEWAQGRKQLRMEYFYRSMRRKYGVLLDVQGGPEGGKWNYDASNRQGWRGGEQIPERPELMHDSTTDAVISMVRKEFPNHPGNLDKFYLAVTASQAEEHLQWFLEFALPRFGQYQDALAEESPWLFHSLLGTYLNIGLLDPLDVCQRVEKAWRAGQCSLAAAEGYIRQVLGWREYVRGIYWLNMPEYAQLNVLQANRPVPPWFWTGDTDMRCLRVALEQTLDLGYAHHIQRLMVIGNFALLAGLDVQEVCAWYLAVYVDAFEWVELPNTLGMALHADGGVMASKPYAASGKYIQRQGNHCKQCRYSPAKMTGPDACPYNSLYWHFIDRHLERWRDNARMGLVVSNWQRRAGTERAVIVDWAENELHRLAPSVAEA